MAYCDTSGPIITVANIESDVADHCNLSCAGCNHFAPFMRPGFYNLHDFKLDIRALAPLLHAKRWYLIGGEPLLNPRLTDYAKTLREAGICDEIYVWTNGLRLPSWDDPELFRVIDRLMISRYPGINYEMLDAWLRDPPCNFGLVPVGHFFPSLGEEQSAEEAKGVFDRCKPRRSCHQVYRGAYYLCPQSMRLPLMTGRREIKDGCALHEPDLDTRLRAHLQVDRAALASCRFCRAYEQPPAPHRQEFVPPALKTSP